MYSALTKLLICLNTNAYMYILQNIHNDTNKSNENPYNLPIRVMKTHTMSTENKRSQNPLDSQ
jgi:hypothetical protein